MNKIDRLLRRFVSAAPFAAPDDMPRFHPVSGERAATILPVSPAST